ncbi:MAG: hypothetical protein LBJ31_04430 [Treponema sp.]|nr:hypothetical protein [Treponema sp.]
MKKVCCSVFTLALFFTIVSLDAQEALFGDAAIAQKYIAWAEGEVSLGRGTRALLALERGSDYAASSSDLSYLLALLRDREGRATGAFPVRENINYSRGAVLAACRQALLTDRWERYTAEAARLLEARTLVELRRYHEAVFVLLSCDPMSADTVYWRLRALRGLNQRPEFNAAVKEALEAFPRDTRFARIFFDYAARTNPLRGSDDGALLDIILRRLPLLLPDDPDLAYQAAPFMTDTELAKSYVAASRSAGTVRGDSIPAALRLGLVDGKTAVAELFAAARRDGCVGKNLLLAVWNALGDEESRVAFRQNLSYLSLVVEEDEDFDGVIEGAVLYSQGMMEAYFYDSDQDRIYDWNIYFARGIPESGEIAVPVPGVPVMPVRRSEKQFAGVRWERYPAVFYVELETTRYIPRPLDFFFTPLRFVPLVPPSPGDSSGGFGYPKREDPQVLSERSLLSWSVRIEKESAEFKGGREWIELEKGQPVKSRTIVNGREAAETEYRAGRPVLGLVDLDLDGRKETRRTWYEENGEIFMRSESDWDNDGIAEYSELRNSSDKVLRSWDLDKDGVRETLQGN